MLEADKYGGKDQIEGMFMHGIYDLLVLVIDLSRMYKLFSRVPAGLSEMRMAISKYIMQLGAEINKTINADLAVSKAAKSSERGAGGGTQTAIRWVEQVLALQEKFDRILEKAANKDKSFQTAFNEVNGCEDHR